MTAMYNAACKWLELGRDLVPLQPRSKRLIAGFGPHVQHITDRAGASFWFQERACNLAIVTGNGLIVLDFDTQERYTAWRDRWPVCAQTYTELTRRGAHVFLAGDSASGIMDGIEIKGAGSVVMSSPSVHPLGDVYHAIDSMAGILAIPRGFPLLSENNKSHNPLSRKKAMGHGGDTVTRIKAAYPLLEYAQSITRLKQHGRWWHGRCPIEEHKKSRHAGKTTFWVDTERGLWGCYACYLRGDVINLYAGYNHISVKEAIRRMAASL